MKKIKTYHRINFMLGAIGMIGVWITTENWWAMLWAFIATLHFTKEKNNL